MSTRSGPAQMVERLWEQTLGTASQISHSLAVLQYLAGPIDRLERQAWTTSDSVLAVLNPAMDAPLDEADVRTGVRHATATLRTLDALAMLEKIRADHHRIVRDVLMAHEPRLPSDDVTRREVYGWLASCDAQVHEPATLLNMPLGRRAMAQAAGHAISDALRRATWDDQERLSTWLNSDDTSSRPDPRPPLQVELDVLRDRFAHRGRTTVTSGRPAQVTPVDQYLASLELNVLADQWCHAPVYGPLVSDLRAPCIATLRALECHASGTKVDRQMPLGEALLDLNEVFHPDAADYATRPDDVDLAKMVRSIAHIANRTAPIRPPIWGTPRPPERGRADHELQL